MSDNFEAEKSAAEILDFVIDYQAELADTNPVDQIASSTWALEDNTPDALTMLQDDVIGTRYTRVRVSAGGRLNQTHRLVNRATCISGMVLQRTIKVTMVKK
jgi:hypothetical protein